MAATAARSTLLILGLLVCQPTQAIVLEERQPSAAQALVTAYPDFIDRIDGSDLVWKDGTRMSIDDGRGPKTFQAMLDHPDIKDMFLMTYPLAEK